MLDSRIIVFKNCDFLAVWSDAVQKNIVFKNSVFWCGTCKIFLFLKIKFFDASVQKIFIFKNYDFSALENGQKKLGSFSLPCLAYPNIIMPIISGKDTKKQIIRIAKKITTK
jgi:hypothetical protein